jgi:hypothetical protein
VQAFAARLLEQNHETQSHILILVASLSLMAALPALSFAQGIRAWPTQKADRFVNRRDDRWNGRGSRLGRRSAVGNFVIRHQSGNAFRYRSFDRNEQFRIANSVNGIFNRANYRRWERMQYRQRYLRRNSRY